MKFLFVSVDVVEPGYHLASKLCQLNSAQVRVVRQYLYPNQALPNHLKLAKWNVLFIMFN